MDFSTLLAGGAVAGFVAATWQKLKDMAWRVVSLLIFRVQLDNSQLAEATLQWLLAHGTPSRYRDRVYDGFDDHTATVSRLLAYERYSNKSLLFWVHGRPIVWSCEAPVARDITSAGSGMSPQSMSSTAGKHFLTFIRGTFKLDTLIGQSTAHFNAWRAAMPELSDRFAILQYSASGESQCRMGSMFDNPTMRFLGQGLAAVRPDPLAGLVYPPEVLEVIEDAKRWRRSRDWYARHAVPWKTGWLLHGAPGTGKSALALAVAQSLNLPLLTVRLGGMSNATFTRWWADSARFWLPAIVLFEDFDNVFHGRENVSCPNGATESYYANNGETGIAGMKATDGYGPMHGPPPLNFDTFLNSIDGVDRCEGLFVILTANDVTRIDPAIGGPVVGQAGSTRPGRIDRTITLTAMTNRAELEALVRLLLGDYPDEVPRILAELAGAPPTPAQVRELCGRRALKRYWNPAAPKPKIFG